MTLKIKTPPMPEPVANVSASDPVRGIGFVKPDKSYFTADQLAARDAQWLELVGPVVEALVNSNEIINQLAACHDDQSCPAIAVAREFLADNIAALRAITEDQE